MKASTGVSGARPTQSLRQEGARSFGQLVPTHLIILALACVLWWIARDMVSTSRTLAGVTQVEFRLSEELAGKWRIMTPQMRVSLDVSGPMREINEFEGEMLKNVGRFSYQYAIAPDDLQNVKPDGRYQVALLVDPEKLQLAGGARPPAELNIRLIAGEHTVAGQDQRIRVVLEQVITRPVTVGVAGITGILPGYQYRAEVQDVESLRVVGPASEVERIMQEGKAYIYVAGTLIEDILRNRAQVEGTDRDALLQQGSIVSTLPLVPPPGGEVRDVAKGGIAGDVKVKITFEKQETVPKNGEFEVNLTYPGWLTTKKNVKVSGWPAKIPVLMDVSQDTQSAWPDAVKAVLDLSHLQEDDKGIEKSENSPRRTLKLAGMHVSLQIDAERLKAFKKPGVTDWRQYVPINEITIEWEEP